MKKNIILTLVGIKLSFIVTLILIRYFIDPHQEQFSESADDNFSGNDKSEQIVIEETQHPRPTPIHDRDVSRQEPDKEPDEDLDEVVHDPGDHEADSKEIAEEPDDLTIIEGIGPKISTVLMDAGIITYAQLADMDITTIKEILTEAGVRIAIPDTWPEQASFAASGDWEQLQQFKGELRAGRKVS